MKKRVIGRPFSSGQDRRRNTKGRPPLNQSLAERIRIVGFEMVDGKSDCRRIEKVIRSLYASAMKGSIQAAALLFLRGWGRAPFEADLDIGADLERFKQECEEEGIDWEADPVLSAIIGSLEHTNEDGGESAVS